MVLRMRRGFAMPVMLLVFISIASILAMGGSNMIGIYNTRTKVDNLIEREKRIRDAFCIYAQKADGRVSSLKTNEDFIKFMLHEQLLPAPTGDIKHDTKYWLDNGFKNELEIKYDRGAWISMSSKIDDKYANKYYLSSGSKNDPAFTDSKSSNVGHRYTIPLEIALLIAKANKENSETETFKEPLKGKQWVEEPATQNKESLGVILEPKKEIGNWVGSKREPIKNTW